MVHTMHDGYSPQALLHGKWDKSKAFYAFQLPFDNTPGMKIVAASSWILLDFAGSCMTSA
jgi:hypothetical protein